MKKKTILKATKLALFAASLAGGVFLTHTVASAHGYVESPASRGYTGKIMSEKLGWSQAFEQYGNVITNPQSLEAKKGFPFDGPADGHIASAEGGLNQIGDFTLDNQSANRWIKYDMKGGPNQFTWKYTAAHKTTKWHYYITKKGWDPNKPLERSEFEPIGTVTHDGSVATNHLTHTINVPTDRSGYYVILAVWDVADTENAFYNVIDVNLQNDSSGTPTDTEAPSVPTKLQASQITTSSVKLNWEAAQDNVGIKEYQIFRDNKLIGTTGATNFEDKNLNSNTEYQYTVKAVDFADNISESSKPLSVKTDKIPEQDITAPTTPTGLHSMNITSSSIDLMWSDSSDNVSVDHYEIYRNGKLTGTSNANHYMDNGLAAKQAYTYTIIAVDAAGNKSNSSLPVTIQTKADSLPTEKEWKPGTFTSPILYTTGEKVSYQGKVYLVKVTHYNYGDTNWAPSAESSLFQLV